MQHTTHSFPPGTHFDRTWVPTVYEWRSATGTGWLCGAIACVSAADGQTAFRGALSMASLIRVGMLSVLLAWPRRPGMQPTTARGPRAPCRFLQPADAHARRALAALRPLPPARRRRPVPPLVPQRVRVSTMRRAGDRGNGDAVREAIHGRDPGGQWRGELGEDQADARAMAEGEEEGEEEEEETTRNPPARPGSSRSAPARRRCNASGGAPWTGADQRWMRRRRRATAIATRPSGMGRRAGASASLGFGRTPSAARTPASGATRRAQHIPSPRAAARRSRLRWPRRRARRRWCPNSTPRAISWSTRRGISASC